MQHVPSDHPTDAPTVDELLAHLGKQTGFSLDDQDEGDRIAQDYAHAEPSVTE